jgi:hypothetical protein
VYLTVLFNWPRWVTGTDASETRVYRDHPENAGKAKPPEYHWPADLTVNGPWAWFVAHLMARYRVHNSDHVGFPRNPYGPHVVPYPGESASPSYSRGYGNPEGAWIDGLEILNEANHWNWPQDDANGNTISGYYVAALAYTAYQYAAAYSWPPLLLPGTLDVTQDVGDRYVPRYTSEYTNFTTQCVQVLHLYGIPPAVPLVGLGWSQHNYGDIKYGGAESYSTSRARQTKLIIGPSWNNTVFLTEGGYDCGSPNVAGTPIADTQSSLCHHNYNEMASYNDATTSYEIPIWTNYGLNDIAAGSNSGFFDDFQFSANPPKSGAARTIATSWLGWGT